MLVNAHQPGEGVLKTSNSMTRPSFLSPELGWVFVWLFCVGPVSGSMGGDTRVLWAGVEVAGPSVAVTRSPVC